MTHFLEEAHATLSDCCFSMMLWAKLVELVLYPPTFTWKNCIQNECGVQKVPHAQLYVQELDFKYNKMYWHKMIKRYTMQKWILKNTKTILLSEEVDFRAEKIIKIKE